MNPQDLLLTNEFITPSNHLEDLPRSFNNTRKKAYQELRSHLRKEVREDQLEREQKAFVDDEEDDFDQLEPAIYHPSLASTLNRSEWLNENQRSLSSTARTLFGKNIEPTNSYRYRKLVISYINVDSKDRNLDVYPDPTSYTIFLNKEYRNVQSIRMMSMEFRETPKPINDTNNCACWTTDYYAFSQETVAYKATLTPAFYTLADFVQGVETMLDLVPHQATIRYFNPVGNNSSINILGAFPRFRLTIDPFTRGLSLIQRLDAYRIASIDTLVGTNQVRITLTFPSLNSTIPNFPFIADETIPIILTGLDAFTMNIGGIPVELIDMVPFYPPNPDITGNIYSYPPTVSPGTPGTIVYTLNVYQADQVTPAVASQTVTLTLNASILPLPNTGHATEVTVGRMVPFTFSCNLGKFMGIQDGGTSRYIQTNKKSGTIINTIPWKIVSNGVLMIEPDNYVLMRLKTPSKPLDTISGNLVCARGSNINQQERGEDFDYFAKIIFPTAEPGNLTIRYVGADRIMYDATLVKLSNLTVEFYKPDGTLLTTALNHSFTLQIIEQREILKETLINSRTGVITDTGAGLISTNPV